MPSEAIHTTSVMSCVPPPTLKFTISAIVRPSVASVAASAMMPWAPQRRPPWCAGAKAPIRPAAAGSQMMIESGTIVDQLCSRK